MHLNMCPHAAIVGEAEHLPATLLLLRNQVLFFGTVVRASKGRPPKTPSSMPRIALLDASGTQGWTVSIIGLNFELEHFVGMFAKSS